MIHGISQIGQGRLLLLPGFGFTVGAKAASSNFVRLKVSDSGTPSLSATQ